MTDDTMRRAIEAGATDLLNIERRRKGLSLAIELDMTSDGHRRLLCEAAEAVIRAALPIVAEEMIGIIREQMNGSRTLLDLARAANDRESALIHSYAVAEAAGIAAALRARLAEMMETT